jgi:hypothetical protein
VNALKLREARAAKLKWRAGRARMQQWLAYPRGDRSLLSVRYRATVRGEQAAGAHKLRVKSRRARGAETYRRSTAEPSAPGEQEPSSSLSPAGFRRKGTAHAAAAASYRAERRIL